MKLLSLTLRNFKGQREFSINPRGNDVSIFGDNATGKTTIADALSWLLFGKDSQNRADFEIKTLDETGKAFPGLDHEVEAAFEVDGKIVELRRVYKETYTKKRGELNAEFTGHSTDYYINTVPVAKKEFDAKIQEICPPATFRVLTDPLFFSTELHWQDRRKQLLSLIGDIEISDVCAMDERLEELPLILDGLTVEELRKVIASKKTSINSEITSIPTRIDEASRTLISPEKPEGSESAIKNEIAQLEEIKAGISVDGGVSGKRVKIQEIDAQILKRKNELTQSDANQIQEDAKALREAVSSKSQWENLIEQRKGNIAAAKNKIAECEKTREEKRNEYLTENAREFAFTGDSTCAACGQALPESEVEAARAKALEEFNERKATKLEAIKAAGMAAKETQESLEKKVEEAEKQISEYEAKVSALDTQIADLQTKVSAVSSSKPESEDATLMDLNEQKAKVLEEIEQIKSSSEAELRDAETKIRMAKEKLAAFETYRAKLSVNEATEKRIEALKADQKRLATEFEELVRREFLTELFVRSKVTLLTERINAKFGFVSFKLFDEQVNGGISECCEATVSGVPFASLNHGSKINAGLDIINTLGEATRFTPPIVIDNAEAITRLISTAGQQIRLIVSESDKKLRVSISEARELAGVN